MKAIFPSCISGDLLCLVHLNNGFRMIDGKRAFSAVVVWNELIAL